jgi:PKD domain
VTLDASLSHTNPPGGTLEYLWQQQAPGAPTLSLAPNNKAITATFTAPDPGAGLSEAVTFRIKVTDDLASGGDKNAESDPFTTTVYALPVANAGPDQAIPIRESEVKTVYLTGSGTISRGGITYAWTQTGGLAVTWLTSTDVANPAFQTTGTAGPSTTLTFNLVVGDGTRSSAADQVGIQLNTVANNVPVANAGSDQFVAEHDTVNLNGNGSNDADNDPLTFNWTQDSGVSVVLSGANSATPTFTAPDVPNGQNSTDLVFKLIVNDGFSDSVPSFVTVHVDNTNDAPVALAKAGLTIDTLSQGPVNVNQGDLVLLDGNSSSDINGDTLTYAWTELSNTITITNANTANASFTATAPVGGASYDFKLTVSDGEFSSDSIVHVNVAHVNHPPLADAGANQTVPEGTLVTLDGSNSADTDGDTLSYSWHQTAGTIVTLAGSDTSMPSFTAPNVGPTGEDLTFELTVNDGQGGGATDSVTITVTYVNQDPTANAGPDQTQDENAVVALDGTGSSDPDGNTLTYSWSQTGGPAVVDLSGSDTASPTFKLPEVDRFEDDVVMQLTVDDGYGGTSTDEVTIHIHNVNHPPVSDAGNDFPVQWGHLVNLSGSGMDPDVEEQPLLTYAWTQTGGTSVTISGADTTTPSFTAPTVPTPGYSGEELLTFNLKVTDPNGVYSDDTITVTVTNNGFSPIADAGANQSVDEHSAVTLHGSGSDPNDDPIHFTWTQTGGPSVSLDDENSATLSFMAPFVNAAGATLTFQLLVWDDFGGWGLDSTTVTVNNINDPPTLINPRADVGVLWPPDHRLVPAHILGVVDPDSNATITINRVRQDEPTNGLGDGDTAIDAIINGNTVLLRAERSGTGNGRVYHVCFTAADFEGSVTGCVTVVVPKSKKTDAAGDGGSLYDSTH